MISEAKKMDCIEYMRSIKDDFIDLTVTSPPYDNLRDYNGYTFDYRKTLDELFRVTKSGGVVVWIVNDQTIDGSESGTSFEQALYAKKIGFKLHDTMIWYKAASPFPSHIRYYQSFEYMFIFSKGVPKTVNLIKDRKNVWANTPAHGTYRMVNGQMHDASAKKNKSIIGEYGIRFNVWEMNGQGNETGHPAPFPLKLVQDHILSWSNKGDNVLDPFLGSGTTRIAAHILNRNFYGCEISQEYFEKQEERFENYSSQMRMDI